MKTLRKWPYAFITRALLATLATLPISLTHAAEIAKYNFESLDNGHYSVVGPALSTDTDAGTTASPFNYFGLSGTRCVIQNNVTGKKISLRDIDIQSSVLNSSMGFSFTVTPTSPISLATLSFASARTANGAGHFGIRYRIGTGSYVDLVTDEPLTNTGSLSTFEQVAIDITDSALQNVSQPIEFRFYAWGAAGVYSYDTCLDDITLTTWDPVVTIPINFDGFTVGASLNGRPQGNTTWSVGGLGSSGLSSIKVSSDFAQNGPVSIAITDNDNNFPRATLDLVNAGYIPAIAQSGKITFYVREDASDGATEDEFQIDLGKIMIRGLKLKNNPAPEPPTPPRISLFLNNKLLANGAVDGQIGEIARGFNLPNVSYVPTSWNKFTVEFDNVAKTALLYLNDKYLSCLALRPGESGDFSVSSFKFGMNSGNAGLATGDKFYLDAIDLDFSAPRPPAPWRSELYPANWNPGYADAQGRSLQDFSYAGYQKGAVPVPTTPPGLIYNVVTDYNADPTGATDSTAAIQAAIDAVPASGGIVYLPAGTYKVAPVGTNGAALRINKNKVVLRGAGPDLTRIFNSTSDMHGKSVVAISSPSTTVDWYAGLGNNGKLLTADVPIGAVDLPVNNTTGITVGDWITLRNDLTTAFIAEIGNGGLQGWNISGNAYPGRTLAFYRKVVEVTSNSIKVDVPIRYPVRVRDNGRVVKPTHVPVQESGLENFSIGTVESPGPLSDADVGIPGTATYKVDNAFAVRVSGAENCWVKNVDSYKPVGNATYHLLSGGIMVNQSRFVTVDACDFKFSQYRGINGNGYLFAIYSEESLYQDCTGESGRHNFSFNKMYTSGNVILRMYSKKSQQSCDFHQYFSVANLIDSATLDEDVFESRLRKEGNTDPGQTSTESVFWNSKGVNGYIDGGTQPTNAVSIIQSHQQGNGYVIGTQGPKFAVDTTDYVEGVGKSTALVPQSLYLDQRFKRLGF